jgi:hypothetical protein
MYPGCTPAAFLGTCPLNKLIFYRRFNGFDASLSLPAGEREITTAGATMLIPMDQSQSITTTRVSIGALS